MSQLVNGGIIRNERGVPICKIYDYGKFFRLVRLPASTIGSYFEALTRLIDQGYNVI